MYSKRRAKGGANGMPLEATGRCSRVAPAAIRGHGGNCAHAPARRTHNAHNAHNTHKSPTTGASGDDERNPKIARARGSEPSPPRRATKAHIEPPPLRPHPTEHGRVMMIASSALVTSTL